MRKKITSKTKFFAIILFYIVVVSAWYLFGYGFYQNKIDDIVSEKKALTINDSQLPQIFKETDMANSLIDSVQNESLKIEQKITDVKNLNSVKSDFITFCRRYNIKCDEFSPLTQIYYQKQEENKDKKYLPLPINIRFDANFKQTMKLLNNLENFDYNLTIGYLSILPNEKVENNVMVTIVGNLLIKNDLMKQEN